jgi:UDP-N-acetylglucosamine 2-epimerase (non-hydrolysing)
MLITFGTRPEYIKVLPIMREMERRGLSYTTFFTGQHTDLLKNTKKPDYTLSINSNGKNRLDTIVQSILNNEEIFSKAGSVMVQGDTTSAFGTALAAFHRKLPVIHLEAGLRTYDKYNPYPEEFNRKAISALAEIHLCPTLNAESRLNKEGYKDTFVVGNTVLDNLTEIRTRSSNEVIVTLHRREKHDNIAEWFSAINNLAKNNPGLLFVLPIHPNPNVAKHAGILTNVSVIEPLGHHEFIERLAGCKYVITDSGGIQEEAAFLGKPCVVCRDFTERDEGLGTHSILCSSPDRLVEGLEWCDHTTTVDRDQCPYGDGNAAMYVCDIIEEKELNK